MRAPTFSLSISAALLLVTGIPAFGFQSGLGDVRSAGTGSDLAAATPVPVTAPYLLLDNIEGSFVNLATFPVRPMVIGPEGELWALNHHDSSVSRYEVVGGTAPVVTYRLPWHPVALAHWENDTDPGDVRDELIVTCRGSWTVLRIDMETGEYRGVIQLRQTEVHGNDGLGRMAEPGDVLVDPNTDRAFVSCSGADSVLQIDLATSAVERVYKHNGARYDFRCKSPLFLSFDKTNPNNWKVLVAPLHSGNDTGADSNVNPTPPASGNKVVNYGLETNIVSSLPDEDLFVINPKTNRVAPVVTKTGSVLFGQGLNPATGAFWQLNTEARNAVPDQQSEPEIQGEFVENRLSIVTDLYGAPGVTTQVLDFSGTTGDQVGQPFGLTFGQDAAGAHFGRGFLTGLLTDNVTVLEPDGSHHSTLDVPAGSIPRQVLLWSSDSGIEDVALVYCWGTNQVLAYRWETSPGAPAVVFDLGHDPAPLAVRSGREIFFDGHRSRDENSSCASCHIEAGSDMLVWNLEAKDQDDKGPMFTQFLIGLERLEPFHWRGERTLRDFNPAFVGLLGDDEELSDPQFDDFEAYLFSLKNGANPNQNRLRVVDSSIAFDGRTKQGNAVLGQERYADAADPIFNGRHSCNACHALPTGTINDINVDAPGHRRPSRPRLKPTPFNEIWRKQSVLVDIEYDDGRTRSAALLGGGTSHGGVIPDLFGFVPMVNGTSSEEAEDITNFVHQWDQGLAPAVHYAFLLLSSNAIQEAEVELKDYLFEQALARNCDIAVVGHSRDGNGDLVPRRWFWDRDSTLLPGVPGAFLCEDPAFAPRTLRDMRGAALNAGEILCFLGVPVGMARRFAVDADLDGFFDLDPLETAPLNGKVPLLTDTQAPAFTLGPRVPWKTTRVARVAFDTDEPTSATVRYREVGTSVWTTKDSAGSGRKHAFVLTGLRPSTRKGSNGPPGAIGIQVEAETVEYEVEVTATDLSSMANQVQTTLFVRTGRFIDPDFGAEQPFQPDSTLPGYKSLDRISNETHVVESLTIHPLSFVGNDVVGTVQATVTFQRGVPGTTAPNRVVVGRVLREVCDANGCELLEPVPDADLLAGASSVKVNRVFINTKDRFLAIPGQDVKLNFGGPLTGPYIVGRSATDESGQATIDFQVSGLDAMDRLVFDVDAVIEAHHLVNFGLNIDEIVLGNTDDLYVQTESTRSYDGWSFADTGEAASSVKSEELP